VRCPEGEARITVGGNIGAKYIIHAVGPQYPKDGPFEAHDSVLSRAYQNALVEGQKKDIKTIAFSLLGSGIFKGGRKLGEVLLIGVETVVQCAYEGLEEVHMVAEREEELKALLLTAEEFFNKQTSPDVFVKKTRTRTIPIIEESKAKRQKTLPKEIDDVSKMLSDQIVPSQDDEDAKKSEIKATTGEISKKETLGPAPVSHDPHGKSHDDENIIAKTSDENIIAQTSDENKLLNNTRTSPVHDTPGENSVSPQKENCPEALTPVNSKPISVGESTQQTPIHIKRSHRIQILLLAVDDWFEHVFKRYLDNPLKILNCFPGSPLTPMQQRHIVAGFKTIYPQLRSKLRNNMNSWVERRNLVQLFADVDKMIATQCWTPGGSQVRPPVETPAHLQAVYELKIITKAEKEVDAKILESAAEIQELERLFQKLKGQENCNLSQRQEKCKSPADESLETESLSRAFPESLEACT